MTRPGTLLFAVLLLGGWTWFRSTDPDVSRGNQHYQAGEYGQAVDAYRQAQERGDEPGIHHNLGAALYKQAEAEKDEAARKALLEEAEGELRKATEGAGGDDALKSSAFHNLGNVQFQKGQLEEAVQSYKRALRANPNNDDARYNLEMTLRKLGKDKPPPQPQQGQGQGQGQGQQQDQQQGQGQQQDQQQQGQGQGQQQDQQQGQGQQQDQQQGQGQQQDQQQGQGQGQQDQQQGQGQGQQQDQQDQQQGQGQGDQQQDQQDQQGQGDQQDQQGNGQGQGKEMTEDERKLDALERLSRDLRRQKMRNQSGRSPNRRVKPPRDW